MFSFLNFQWVILYKSIVRVGDKIRVSGIVKVGGIFKAGDIVRWMSLFSKWRYCKSAGGIFRLRAL